MPRARRQRVATTDDWQQLQLLAQFAEQRVYEMMRPVVLFGQSPAERARETGTPQSTLSRQVDRFEKEGMASLFAPQKVEKHKSLPDKIRKAILELKSEHPGIRPNEIATICYVRFDRRPSPHTVKRILAEEDLPTLPRRRYPPYHDPSDHGGEVSILVNLDKFIGANRTSRSLPIHSARLVTDEDALWGTSTITSASQE